MKTGKAYVKTLELEIQKLKHMAAELSEADLDLSQLLNIDATVDYYDTVAAQRASDLSQCVVMVIGPKAL